MNIIFLEILKDQKLKFITLKKALLDRIYLILEKDLVHQLNTAFIPKYKDKDMFNVLFSRFDWVDLDSDLQKNIHFRKALALSVDYSELKKLYATGMPGCPSLTDAYIAKKTVLHLWC